MDWQTNWQGQRHSQRERYQHDREALVQQREPDGCEAGLHLAGICLMELESYSTGLILRASIRVPGPASRPVRVSRNRGISLAGTYQRIKFPDQGLLQRLISIPLIAILAGEISFGRAAVSPIEQMPAVAGRSTSPPGGLVNK
jgi:hypothetical protein